MTAKHRKTFENEQYVLLNAWATKKKDMCAYLGIDIRTLDKYYSEEMSKSTASLISDVVTATKIALSESNASVINTLLKGVCGVSETNKVELTGKDGDPIEHVDRTPRLSREEWIAAHSQIGTNDESSD